MVVLSPIGTRTGALPVSFLLGRALLAGFTQLGEKRLALLGVHVTAGTAVTSIVDLRIRLGLGMVCGLGNHRPVDHAVMVSRYL